MRLGLRPKKKFWGYYKPILLPMLIEKFTGKKAPKRYENAELKEQARKACKECRRKTPHELAAKSLTSSKGKANVELQWRCLRCHGRKEAARGVPTFSTASVRKQAADSVLDDR